MDTLAAAITKSPEDTSRLGEALAITLREEGRDPRIVCLYGDLGVGKTTFVQGFARGMGIDRRLPSPTFIIVRRYPITDGSGFLYHLDLYRMQTEKELEDLGIAEILRDTNSFVIIEWAEKLGSFLPMVRMDVRFALREDGSHEVLIQYDGAR